MKENSTMSNMRGSMYCAQNVVSIATSPEIARG